VQVTLDYDPTGVLSLTGTTVCYELGPNGGPVPRRAAVFDIKRLEARGVQRDFGPLLPAPPAPGPYAQTVTYVADLGQGGSVIGLLRLNVAETEGAFGPNPLEVRPGDPPDIADWVIRLGAEEGATLDLCTSNPGAGCGAPTFGRESVLGYDLGPDQVLKFEEVLTFAQDPCATYPTALGAALPDCRPAPLASDIPVYQAVNRVLGTRYTSHADLKPRLVAPDHEWSGADGDADVVVALIASSGGNFNTLGIRTGGADWDVSPPSPPGHSGHVLHSQPFTAHPLPPATLPSLAETFRWYLRSDGFTGNKTFLSDPGLDAKVPDDTDDFDHMVTYDLTTACNAPVRVSVGGVERWAVPAYLLAWEDLDGYGDADANDLMVAVLTLIPDARYVELVASAGGNGAVCAGPTESLRPLGTEGPTYLATRFCHSSNFSEDAPVDCIRDENGRAATGQMVTLAVEKDCPAGQATGNILVEARYRYAWTWVGWEAMNCGAGQTSAGQRWYSVGTSGVAELGAGSPLRVRAIGGNLWSLMGQGMFGVKRPGDVPQMRSRIDCTALLPGQACEAVEFSLADLDGGHSDRFSGVELRFLVGSQGSQQVKVVAYDGEEEVFSRTITATAGPASSLSPQVIDLGGKLATRIRFEALPGGAFGLDSGILFGTVAR
jgi:hypothetical protein